MVDAEITADLRITLTDFTVSEEYCRFTLCSHLLCVALVLLETRLLLSTRHVLAIEHVFSPELSIDG